MPPNSPKPEKLVFNQSLLKDFVVGKLPPQVEEKVAAFVEQRPKSLKQAVALSGDGFLRKLKAVQQRTASAQGLGKATASAPESIQPGPTSGTASAEVLAVKNESKVSIGAIPSELANYAGYRIVKELGRGGMGVVYLAKNVQMDRLEVLKVLSERLLDHEGAKERFLREIRAVSKLNHLNIVTSYSILPLSSLLVFAMEHVHGMDLHGFIHKHAPLSIGLACAFAKQLAAGLQHAHEKGLVHRDIKPSNVIVYKSDGQLQLKILDFGLAKATSEDNQSGLTQDGMMLGTPEYMSPEQTLNAAKADIRADIYSLGCTLYCMLTGRPPFRGTHGEVLMAHAQRDPQSVNLLRPEVPVELSAIVAKMMAKDVAKRFQTPAQVATALSPWVNQDRSGNRSTTDSPAAPNNVHDLQASDRDTSVEAPAPSLSLDTASQLVQPTSELAEIAQAMGEHRRAVTQVARAKHHQRKKSLAPKWMWPAVIAGLMTMSLGGLWLAGVFKFKTPDGTIIVEQLPEDADVLVDGRRLEIAWNAGKDRAEVTIEPGTHQLKVTSKGIEVFGNRVQVRSGAVLSVRCGPLPATPPGQPLPQMQPATPLQTSAQEPSDVSKPDVPTDSRTLWMHSQGMLEKVDQKWIEYSIAKPRGVDFVELHRNNGFVELESTSNRSRVRLFANSYEIQEKPDAPFEHVFSGYWHFVNENAPIAADEPQLLTVGDVFRGEKIWTTARGNKTAEQVILIERGAIGKCEIVINQVNGRSFEGSMRVVLPQLTVNREVTGAWQGNQVRFVGPNEGLSFCGTIDGDEIRGRGLYATFLLSKVAGQGKQETRAVDMTDVKRPLDQVERLALETMLDPNSLGSTNGLNHSILIGKWKVEIDEWSVIYTFKSDGKATLSNAKFKDGRADPSSNAMGDWMFDSEKSRVIINWDNGCTDAFDSPIDAKLTKCTTVIHPKGIVAFTAVKISSETPIVTGDKFVGTKTYLDSVQTTGREAQYVLTVESMAGNSFSGTMIQPGATNGTPIEGSIEDLQIRWHEIELDHSEYVGTLSGDSIEGKFDGLYLSNQKVFGKVSLTRQHKPSRSAEPTSTAEARKPIELLQGDLAESWVMSDLHVQHWSLKKGILRFDGVGMDALNLTTKRTDFKNFTLNCQWRIGPNGDSGLYLRGKPQVQIWDHVNGKGAGIGSGGLYNNKVFPSRPLAVADNPLGQWNMMSTTIAGDIVTVVLNGRTVTNGVRMEHYPDYQSDLPSAGPLILQTFGTPLEFRRMTLTELP